MADNVVLLPGGGGDTIAADDVAGTKYPLTQLVTGADGAAKSLVTGNVGLPVSIVSNPATLAGGNLIQINYATSGLQALLPMVGIPLPGPGGPAIGGTVNNPLRVEPTGMTPQMVTGTVAVVPFDPELKVTDRPVTSGGLAAYSFLSTAAVQAATVKALAGQAYGLQFFNKNTAPAYVRLYDQATAPGSGDGANIKWRGMVPGNTGAAGFTIPFDKGLLFVNGIGLRVTAGVGDADNTALPANDIMGNVLYK